MKVNNILETIGKTPVVRLSKIFPDHQVWMKLEKTNPAGSIKDRIALAMISRIGVIEITRNKAPAQNTMPSATCHHTPC